MKLKWGGNRSQAVLAFLHELDIVCEKHGFALEHEDGRGDFEVVRTLNPKRRKWLAAANEKIEEPES